MGAFIFVMAIIVACMWVFGRMMYPRAPRDLLVPKAGDVVTPRNCYFCGHSLAEYRGIVEPKVVSDSTNSSTWFFCNGEHQADFHAGKVYQPYQ